MSVFLPDLPYVPSFVEDGIYAYTAGHGAWYLATQSSGRAILARDVKMAADVAKTASRFVWRHGGSRVATWAARASGSVAAGYLIGASVGTAISYAIWGREGAEDAINLYTGGVSAQDYFDTVGIALNKTFS